MHMTLFIPDTLYLQARAHTQDNNLKPLTSFKTFKI